MFHMMVLRIDDLIFDWEEPPKKTKDPLTKPREQGFYTTASTAQAVLLPPSIPPSVWQLRDDVVDVIVASTGWNLAPISDLMIRFVGVLDKLPPTKWPLGLKWTKSTRGRYAARQ